MCDVSVVREGAVGRVQSNQEVKVGESYRWVEQSIKVRQDRYPDRKGLSRPY